MDKKTAEYLLKKGKKDYILIANYYSTMRPRPWGEMEFLVKNYLKNKDSVLDLGCGSGRFFELMKDKKINYIGVDNSQRFIDIAIQKYPYLKFLPAEATDLHFERESFDKVYAIALLHHIPSEELRLKVLKEVKKVLKKDGLFILTVWNLLGGKKIKETVLENKNKIDSGESKLDKNDILKDWEDAKDVYFHCFEKGELEKLAKKAGFEVLRSGEIPVGSKEKLKSKFPSTNLYIIAKKNNSQRKKALCSFQKNFSELKKFYLRTMHFCASK